MNALISIMLMLFFFILGGIYLKKVIKVPKETSKILSALVINLTTPCTIISPFLAGDNQSKLSEMGVVFWGVIMMCLIPAAIGAIFARIFRYAPSYKGTVIFLFTFPNNIFMGFPIILELLGSEALKYAALMCIPLNATIFSLGIFLIAGEQTKLQWKKLFNPGLVASGIALIFYLTNLSLPTFVEQAVVNIGNITVPLAMIIFGIILSDIPFKEIIGDYRGYSFSLLKLILVPIATWLVFDPIIKNPVIAGVFVITAAMPSANVSIMLSEEYGKDPALALKYVGISTIISMITIPLIGMVLI